MSVQTQVHVLRLVQEHQSQIQAFGVKRLGLFGVEYDIVWDAVGNKIPLLQSEIQQIIEAEGTE